MSSDKEKAFFAKQPKLNGGRRYNPGERETGSPGATVHHGNGRSWQEKRS